MDLYTWKKLLTPVTNNVECCVLLMVTRSFIVAKNGWHN
jgi:hypothetical protein